MIESILTNETVVNAIAGFIGLALTALFGFIGMKLKSWIGDQRKASLIDGLIRDSVWSTYEALVKDWKAASADGKLTPEEKKAALDHAMKTLTTQAMGNGLDIVSELGPERMRGMIEAGVQAFKSGNVTALSGPEPRRLSAPTTEQIKSETKSNLAVRLRRTGSRAGRVLMVNLLVLAVMSGLVALFCGCGLMKPRQGVSVAVADIYADAIENITIRNTEAAIRGKIIAEELRTKECLTPEEVEVLDEYLNRYSDIDDSKLNQLTRATEDLRGEIERARKASGQ